VFATRDGAGNHAIYHGAAQLISSASVGGSLPAHSLYFFADDDNGSATADVVAQQTLAFLCITSGMNAAQAAALYTRVQAFQVALGRQV
jgi:hypothetical protein